jgi:hypothetical protein
MPSPFPSIGIHPWRDLRLANDHITHKNIPLIPLGMPTAGCVTLILLLLHVMRVTGNAGVMIFALVSMISLVMPAEN